MRTYHFVALKQNSDDIEHILTVSLVVGYIYCNIAYKIPCTISYEIDSVVIVLSSLCLGYASGILLRGKKIVYILDFLKIRDTGNVYLWDDLMDNDYPMKACVKYDDKIYEGMIHNYESYTNSPHIVLCSYVVKDVEGHIVENFLKDETKVVVLNIDDSKVVCIEYYHDSQECKDLRSLCVFNERFIEQDQ